MNPSAREILSASLPPALVGLLRAHFGTVRFGGDYPSWEAAMRDCNGYDMASILERVKQASLEVKEGRAVFERDSVLFDRIEYSWPVLACLLWIARRLKSGLHVLDFGGSLGSSYRQNLGFLKGLEPLRWSVVEQAHFVECGRRFFDDGILRFFPDVDDCIGSGKPDVVLFSSVLHYLEKPYEVLEDILSKGIDYIIVDRTPFLKGNRDRLTVQKISKRIYPASYPAWYFSKGKFLRFFENRYDLVEEFDALDHSNIRSRYLGFLFRRRGLHA
jgi:putative methyltransferase (TIGR04325 family)